MIAPIAPIDWRIGSARILLPATIHGVAAVAAAEAAREWPAMWLFAVAVAVSAVDDLKIWIRERGRLRTLALVPGGISIDAQRYRARRAWLGPGWTAIWLRADDGRRRLVYVMRGEVTVAAHAALRRHLKSLGYV
jgi:hypothetical protein